jgi:hypothetical protein
LHNIRRKLKLPEDEHFLADVLFEYEPEDLTGHSANQVMAEGNRVRDQIRQAFFN